MIAPPVFAGNGSQIRVEIVSAETLVSLPVADIFENMTTEANTKEYGSSDKKDLSCLSNACNCYVLDCTGGERTAQFTIELKSLAKTETQKHQPKTMPLKPLRISKSRPSTGQFPRGWNW